MSFTHLDYRLRAQRGAITCINMGNGKEAYGAFTNFNYGRRHTGSVQQPSDQINKSMGFGRGHSVHKYG
jgi:hypothetical protein